MNRGLPWLGIALLALTLAACGNSDTGKDSPDGGPGASRPNIILILTDDQPATDFRYLPKTTSLIGGEGLALPNFLVTVSLCCPSRASILRGQYAHNHGIVSNGGADGGFEAFRGRKLEESTVATWLHDSGYRTGLFGKYLNEYPGAGAADYIPPGWDSWASPIDLVRAYSGFNYRMNEDGKIVLHAQADDDHLTDVIRDKATRFIRDAAQDGKPFFAYIAPTAPHAPATPPRRFQFAPVELPPPGEAFNEADVGDKPGYVRKLDPIDADTTRLIEAFARQRARSLMAVDELVESVVNELEAVGQLDNTYIFITADNGWMQGEHRLTQGKIVPYDESIRVSMLVRGPGVRRGVSNAVAGNIDLAPTFAEIAGVSPPSFVDGRSLVALLRGEVERIRDAFLFENWLGGGEPGEESTGISEFHGLRTERLKYVEYATGEVELYDLTTDPHEMRNLAAGADPGTLGALSAALNLLEACREAAECAAAENARLPDLVR